MKEHSLLVEKYRPTNIDNYVGNESIKNTIKSYISQNDIQNLLFYGPAGTGKTTLAKLITMKGALKLLEIKYLGLQVLCLLNL